VATACRVTPSRAIVKWYQSDGPRRRAIQEFRAPADTSRVTLLPKGNSLLEHSPIDRYTGEGLDFRTLLDCAFVQRVVCPQGVAMDGMYQGRDGVLFRTHGGPRSLVMQEIVQVEEDVLLLACNWSPLGELRQKQLVGDSDWIHIQFYLEGSGQEWISNGDVVDLSEGSCVVAHYPEGSVIERALRAVSSFRAACLYLRPKALAKLIDVAGSSLLENALQNTQTDSSRLRADTLPLTSAMRVAVNDVLGCTYRGRARRLYMRAKSLELLSAVLCGLESEDPERNDSSLELSPLAIRKMEQARQIIMSELGTPMTLAQLARRLGINRTKLVLGFKQVYGVSVQAYWRDQKLNRAHELLRQGNARVTDVAFDLGYTELSSFTRAFCQKFGYSPSTIK